MMRQERNPDNSVFIQNIPLDTEAKELRDIFEKYGNIKDVRIPRFYHTKKQRGFAYVEFESQCGAEEALNDLQGFKFKDVVLNILKATGVQKSSEEMQKRERHDRHAGDNRRDDRGNNNRRFYVNKENNNPHKRRHDDREDCPANKRGRIMSMNNGRNDWFVPKYDDRERNSGRSANNEIFQQRNAGRNFNKGAEKSSNHVNSVPVVPKENSQNIEDERFIKFDSSAPEVKKQSRVSNVDPVNESPLFVINTKPNFDYLTISTNSTSRAPSPKRKRFNNSQRR